MAEVGRPCCPSPSPLFKQGHLELFSQYCVQTAFEYLQRRKIHNLSLADEALPAILYFSRRDMCFLPVLRILPWSLQPFKDNEEYLCMDIRQLPQLPWASTIRSCGLVYTEFALMSLTLVLLNQGYVFLLHTPVQVGFGFPNPIPAHLDWRVSIFLLGHLYLLSHVACCLFKSEFSQDLLVHPCSQPAAFAWQWLNSSLGTRCVWQYRHRKRVQGRKFSSWRNRVNSSMLISMSTSNIYTRYTTAKPQPSTPVCRAHIPTVTYLNHTGGLPQGRNADTNIAVLK